MNGFYLGFFAVFFSLFSPFVAWAFEDVAEGAWCWFADPRAVHCTGPDGDLDRTFIGYIDTHGSIKALQYDFNLGCAEEVLVRSCFQPDDHNNPTFLVVPDGRVMIFYSRHTDEPCFYYRISRHPADITDLSPEFVIPMDHNTTYPSPFVLDDDPDHFYLCWRGINWHPTVARFSLPDEQGSVDLVDGPFQIVQSSGARPYAKYCSDGKCRIGLAYTTGHPDNECPNFVYYNYIDIRDMSLRDVNGRSLACLRDSAFRVDSSRAFCDSFPDVVVDDSSWRDWVWQLLFDSNGGPMIAMTRISPDKGSHNYFLARFDGSAWRKHFIAHGGAHFHQSPDIEHCYSGGMAVDPSSVSDVYCSVPVVGANGLRYEIIKFVVDADGCVLSQSAVTSNSTFGNFRPYLVEGALDSPLRLIWLCGEYFDWIVSSRSVGYPSRVVCDFDGFSPKVSSSEGDSLSAEGADVKFDKPFSVSFRVDSVPSEGLTVDLGALAYVVDGDSLLPSVVIDGKRFTGVCPLANSDAWRSHHRATDGKWLSPTALRDFVVGIRFSDGVLKCYVDGALNLSCVVPKSILEVSK